MKRRFQHLCAAPGAMSPWALHVFSLVAVCAWAAVPLLPSYWPRVVVTAVAVFVVSVVLSELRDRAELSDAYADLLREDLAGVVERDAARFAHERTVEPGGPL